MKRYYILLVCLFHLCCLQGQESVENINKLYNYFSHHSKSDLWLSSIEGWHRYNGLELKNYYINNAESGLKGEFIQNGLIPDSLSRLWTSTYDQLCYFDENQDVFHCFQPIYNQDTLNQGLKAIHFFEEENELLFNYQNHFLLLNTEDFSVSSFSETITDGAVFKYIPKQKKLLSSSWISSPEIEKWSLENYKWSKEILSFANCNSPVANCLVSDFYYDQATDITWLATSKGLVKCNEASACESDLYLFENEIYYSNKLTEFLQYLIISTDQDGLLIFDRMEEEFVTQIQESHPSIPLNLNNTFEVFDAGDDFVISFGDAPLQTINKTTIKAEIELGVSLKSNSSSIIESNSQYVCVSDRENLIAIYGTDLSLIHKIDISDIDLIDKIVVTDQELFCASKKKIYQVNLQTGSINQIFESKSMMFDLFENNKELHFIGVEKGVKGSQGKFMDYRSPKIQESFVRYKYIDDAVFSSTTNVLQVNLPHTSREFTFEGFISKYKKGRNDKEVLIIAHGGLYLLDLSSMELQPITLNENKFNDVIVKDKKTLVAWGDNGVFEIDDQNRIRKIIHDKEIKTLSYFQNDFIYTTTTGLKLVSEDQVISKALKDSIKVNTSNHKLSKKENTYYVNYHHTADPLKLDFKMNSILANEFGYYTYSVDGRKGNITSIDKPLPINYFPHGKTKVSVQAFSQDGSLANQLNFQVKVRGPIWKKWWFYLILASLLISGIIYYYKIRERNFKEKYKLKQEINQLEKSALQAQMNPHFIFNCLNSIQSFIMKNDKENAMEYLGRFAQLIRANLNASMANKISLTQEIRILDNYLKLERLRLNEVFEYYFNFDNNISEDDVFIPPMLIQPFVENAVIHGMKNKESGGEIVMNFTVKENNLVVEIKDNGNPVKNPSKSDHKSVGVEITRKRLSHINKTSKEDVDLSINHTADGTIVLLSIKDVNSID